MTSNQVTCTVLSPASTEPNMDTAIPCLLLFDPAREPSRRRLATAATHTASERRLYCITCHQLVTHLDERIVVNGGTEHTVRNPYGIEFHIGCFKSAYGCRAHGTATGAYTWFPGYAWRLALCANCGLHLGWHYHSNSDDFFGLILSRLSASAAE